MIKCDKCGILGYHNSEVLVKGTKITCQKYLDQEQENGIKEKDYQEFNSVTNPKHYQILPNVQVIDVRDAILSKLPAHVPYKEVDYWSRAWEYLTRMYSKNGLEDAKKARWYLDRLINSVEKK